LTKTFAGFGSAGKELPTLEPHFFGGQRTSFKNVMWAVFARGTLSATLFSIFVNAEMMAGFVLFSDD